MKWLADLGPVGRVGVEGTGSYGAGLTRYLRSLGISVIEVNRADRQDRRRQGKSDPLDAISAARAAQSGRAAALPKGSDGEVEAIRMLLVAKRSARRDRTSAINQLRGLLAAGPDDLRERLARHSASALVAETAAVRPRAGDIVEHATRVTLRELGRRARSLDEEIVRLDKLIGSLVAARGAGLLELFGVGPDTAATLLVTAGDHPERLRSEAAFAQLCGVAPIPASSGKVTRHRLNRAGDRQANQALWRIVFVRMGSDPRTRTYVERRTAEGKSKAEIMRCLKRYVAREVYPFLRG
jgi:transposase